MAYKYSFILFLIVAYIFESCCEDDDRLNPQVANCNAGIHGYTEPAFPMPDSAILTCDTCFFPCYEVESPDIPFDYLFPCFDPSNSNRLAYYRRDNSKFDIGYELWIIDFCTGDQILLVDNARYGIDWGINDWLVYTATDQNIWKIRSNGDSLTQLTTVGDFNRYPTWSPNGKKIAYNLQTQSNSYFLISNSVGEEIDTIEELNSAGAWSWIDDDHICYLVTAIGSSPTKINLNTINITTRDTRFLHSLTVDQTVDSLIIKTVIIDEGKSVVWCAYGLIGKTDLTTGSYTIIQERLIHERFEFLTCTPGDDQLMFNKTSKYIVNPCRFNSERELYMITKDGEDLRKVNIPN